MKHVAVVVLALAVLATACQSGNVFTLTAGDCFNDPEAFEEVVDVDIVDCSEAHDNEVYATYDMVDATYPGQAAAQEAADSGCFDRFEPFVGADYLDSALAISFLTPSDASWDQGDREVVCFLYDLSGNTLVDSVRGTGI